MNQNAEKFSNNFVSNSALLLTTKIFRMSYLAQVIAQAGEAEIMDLKYKIAETGKRIKSLDKEVKDYLENNYMKFTGLLQENHLILRAKDLASEITQLENRINNRVKKELDASTEDFRNLSSKLSEVYTCMVVVERLLSVDNMIRAAEEDQNRSQYLEAAQKYKTLKEELATDEHLRNLKVYESLLNHVTYLYEKFSSDSIVVWNEFISWNEVDVPNNSKRIILTINNVEGKSDIIRVLLYYDYLDYEVRLLSKKLYECVLEPIIKYNASVHIQSDEGVWVVILEYKMETAKIDTATCMNIIDNLWNVLNTLLESLDAFISEEETFIHKIGELLENDFCECFLEHCLYKAIPTKKEEFAEYEEVAEKIRNFDQFLKENAFMRTTNTQISDCVKNVDNLFLSKTCQTYLADAKKIFDKDLHDMVHVVPTLSDKLYSKMNTDDPDLAMCKNALQPPACYISKSTQELLQLISNAFEKISTSDTSYGIELYYTVRDIISLYCDIMPLKHSILLKSIPQQSALFYNNCMYLAHELITLGMRMNLSSVLPDTVKVTFVDFIEPLKSLGYSVLDSQVETQVEQIFKILSESGLSSVIECAELPATVEKSLKQCLRQLTLLQSVWRDIMPQNVYCKTLGRLCSCFLEKLIDSILQLEDISVNMASQLTTLFENVTTKVPTLFPNANEIHRYVKKWSKFQELLNILNGSLKDIDDRWADGKGPLAQEYTPDQVKHLIRALFQHTDRRSALLSRIR